MNEHDDHEPHHESSPTDHVGEVEAVLRKVKGFAGNTLMRTGDGGLSVTVRKDKAGTDESVVVARDWVKKNASGTGVAPPTLTEGSVILHLK